MKRFIVNTLAALAVMLIAVSRLNAAEVVTYYHNNYLGSPIAATDSSGAVIWQQAYDPWGLKLTTNTDERGYTGNWLDEETGLADHKARWMTSAIGRFTAIDPLSWNESNIHSFNRYAYANDNPYAFVDPSGSNGVTGVGGLIVESYNLLTGKGFNAGRVWGAFKDGYNGAGAGFVGSAVQDVTTFVPIGAIAGAMYKSAKLASLAKGLSETGAVTKGASKEVTKSSRKRIKRLIKNLSDNSRQSSGLSQEKTDQLRRIVERAGGKLRNDGATGVKGSSAGKPHVQTEGLGKSIDSRHIWTKDGVQ